MKNSHSFKIALIFSFTAIFLAVAPGIFSFINTGEFALYSPEISVLTATLIAIIWYTAYTYDKLELQKSTTENEMKSSLTALLSELRWIYDLLLPFIKNGSFNNSQTPTPLPTPILNAVLKDLSKFEGEAVERIINVYRNLSHFEHLREKNVKSTGSIRASAALVCFEISKLVPHLKKKGGNMPTLLREKFFETGDLKKACKTGDFREFIPPEDPYLEIRKK